MKTTTPNITKLEEIEVKEEIMGKKEKKVSITYTLRAFKNNADKLRLAKMITEEEEKTLKDIHAKMLNRWIGIEMGI